MPIICSPPRSHCPLLECLITFLGTLFPQTLFLCKFLLSLNLCLPYFFFCRSKIEMSNEVIVNIYLLLPIFLSTNSFMNDNFINQLASHICG